MKKLDPINIEEFSKKMKINEAEFQGNDYYKIFAETISMVKNLAIGPFYWYIPDNIEMKIKWVSENARQLTPYTKEQWIDQGPEFCVEQFHEEDRPYVLAAIKFISESYLKMDGDIRKNVKFNVFARALNGNNVYTWVMIQVPDIYINNKGEIESSLYIVYDLSHLNIVNKPLLSVIDHSNKEIQYYKHIEQKMKAIDIKLPDITNREKDILKLMSQGFNTPEISQKLYISYNTVENHKRNLRRKTETKTSAELMTYIITYNLAFL